MTNDQKRDAKLEVSRDLSAKVIILRMEHYTSADHRKGGPLIDVLRSGLCYVSESEIAQDGNGFSVKRSGGTDHLGKFLNIIPSVNKPRENILRYTLKTCGLIHFDGDEDKLLFYHKYIRPGTEGLEDSKLLLINRRLNKSKNMVVYAKIPLAENVKVDPKARRKLKARQKKLVKAFARSAPGLLNAIRTNIREDNEIDHYPIRNVSWAPKEEALKQLTKWANKYYKQDDLEKGITVALKAKSIKVGTWGKNKVTKYNTLEL